MPRSRTHRGRRACSQVGAVLSGLLACGDTSGGSTDIAKALSFESKDAAREDATHKIDSLKARAEAQRAKAKADEIARVTAVSGPWLELDAGCEAAGAAYDTFVRKRLPASEIERWDATSEPDIRKVVEACMATQSREVATCEARALAEASPALIGMGGEPPIFEACERHGVAVAGVVP